MKTEKFRDLYFFHPKSTMQAGDGLKEGEFPFYTSSEKLTKWTNSSQFNTVALIFGTGGKANIHFASGRFSVSTDCLVASSKQEHINIKFVFYYLSGNIHILERGFKGAGLKHISKKYIENIDIPIFPLETQNKIVSILDKASALIAKREESIRLSDELLRATFLDMFGDPTISKKYRLGNLSNYVSQVQIGPFGSQLHRADYIENGIPLINPTNIVENKIIPDFKITISEAKYISLPNYHLKEGDIIMGRRGEMGRCGLITQKEDGFFCGTGSLFMRPKEGMDSTFLLRCLTNEGVIEYLNNSAKGVIMKNLNKSILQNIPLISVPIQDQKIFKNKVNAIDKMKEDFIFSSLKLNILFNSTLQRAFNGDLNFNIDEELNSLLKEIDLQKKNNDLSKISNDTVYLQRLIDKLNNQEFEEKDQYDKAKHTVFQLLKEGKKVTQQYKDKRIQLALL
jgi:type I restriction enzyme, S subunit